MTKPRPSAPRAANPPSPVSLLLSKAEVTSLVNRSYQHIWKQMRKGAFPRSRLVGTRPMWLRSEVEAWINNLPRVALKGDDEGAP
jgi:predicted DNA-binding transcriptional regulator AlpA